MAYLKRKYYYREEDIPKELYDALYLYKVEITD